MRLIPMCHDCFTTEIAYTVLPDGSIWGKCEHWEIAITAIYEE